MTAWWCAVVHSWARHSLTNYDKIRTPEHREKLRTEIHRQAANAYPWQRLECDPRKPQAVTKDRLGVFGILSRELGELTAKRSSAMLALRELRHKQPVDRKGLAELESEVGRLDFEIKALFTAVRPDECGDRPLMARHKNGDYYWAGYAFKENYIEPVPDRIICPACEARVWRTKRKVCLGGGVKYVIFSCHCLTAFSSNSGSGFGHILQKWWEGLTAGD